MPHFFDCTCRARVRRLCEINTATGVDWDHPSRFGEERGSLAVEIYRALRRANPLRPLSLSLTRGGTRAPRPRWALAVARPAAVPSRVRRTPAQADSGEGLPTSTPQIRLRLSPARMHAQVVAQRTGEPVGGSDWSAEYRGAIRTLSLFLGGLNGCSARSAGGHCTASFLHLRAASFVPGERFRRRRRAAVVRHRRSSLDKLVLGSF